MDHSAVNTFRRLFMGADVAHVYSKGGTSLQHMQMSEHDVLLTCRIISLAQGYQRSSIALSSQHFPPQLQMTTSAARSQRGNQATPQSASRLRSSVPADQSAAADPTSNSSAGTSEAPAEQDHPVWTSSFVTRGKYAESSAEASDQSTAKHSIGAKDALRASQDMVKDWAAGRLSLDYPPEEDGETDSISSEPLEEHGSMQRASSPVVLHSVLSSLQQVQSFLWSLLRFRMYATGIHICPKLAHHQACMVHRNVSAIQGITDPAICSNGRPAAILPWISRPCLPVTAHTPGVQQSKATAYWNQSRKCRRVHARLECLVVPKHKVLFACR